MRFTVKKKFMSLAITMFTLLIIMGTVVMYEFSQLNHLMTQMYQDNLIPIVHISNVKSDIEAIRSLSNSLMNNQQNSSAFNDAIESIETTSLQLVNEDLTKINHVEGYDQIALAVDAFLQAKDAFIASQNSATQSDVPADLSLITTFDDTKVHVIALLDATVDNHIAMAQTFYTDGQAYVHKNILIVILMISSITLITTIIIFLLGKSIINPLNVVITKLKEIAENEGDLTHRIDVSSKDELGDLSHHFNAFINKLNHIISGVKTASTMLSETGTHMKHVTQESSQTMETLANSVVDISIKTNENAGLQKSISHQSTLNTHYSNDTTTKIEEASNFASEVVHHAQHGSSSIEKVLESMQGISNASQEVVGSAHELEHASKKIGDIITIISSISEQTHLLALNASIEAARAGDAGRGFNVVATEIKKLADESKQATQLISQLVSDTQARSKSVVLSISNVDSEITKGQLQSAEVDKSIHTIIQAIETMAQQIDAIKQTNNDVANASLEINQAMGTMVLTTETIASNTEHISANIEEQVSTLIELDEAATNLYQLSIDLNNRVNGFVTS